MKFRLLNFESRFCHPATWPIAWLATWLLAGPFGGVLQSTTLAADQPESIADFLSLNCIGCHDSGTSEGDLDLESLELQLEDPDNFHLWERVFDRVGQGEMPPDDTLDKEESLSFLSSVHGILKTADTARIRSAGRVPARRLTRTQYERNVQQLLATNIPLSEYLPEETLTNGFDTVSKSQQISNHSMAAYLQSADAALDASFNQLLADAPPPTVRFDWKQLRRDEKKTGRMAEGRPRHKDIVAWSTRQNFYGKLPATTVPNAARYRIRLSVQAVHPPSDGRVWCSVQSGFINAKASTMYWVGSFEATKEPKEYEFEAWIRDDHMLRVHPNDRGLRQVPVPLIGRKAGTLEPMGFPGVAIKWIEMEQIVADRAETRRALIGDLPLRKITTPVTTTQNQTKTNESSDRQFEIVSENPEQDLQELIHSFAQRAFRRSVTPDELKPYLNFARQRFAVDGSMREALRSAYRTILCSPRFLYFEESARASDDLALDDYALANRLSHFLWGVSPDAKLTQLAAAGRLSKPNILRKQTDRLLDDVRSTAFVKEFSDQWLMLYEINSTTPDGDLYPEYDDVLHHTLVDETHAFVEELVNHDMPAVNIVDSDFTFLNSRLARHYDIAWPGGTGLQRVKLDPKSRRGGVITHASVLKVTANGTTTSPITRGVWMLERIMGQHIPPPPANVPAVEPDIRGAKSIRDELEKHKSLESCAACHVKMDPPGFALENYDVIGGWRENYRAVSDGQKKSKWVDGLPVDASHQFVSGESFADIDGMKEILCKHPERIARSLAMHLVTYSTGAAPTFADRETLDAIVAATKSTNYGVRSLLHGVVQSPFFQQK
ncbi:DUF1592 domain-containing protein [Planctomycetes bacterium K23_9]|uniref:Planctomycete cytochrome C n=1 Tax=Stieleria marina TaxID=1930275 RepID=A0A517NM60_9BACT|nr:Planctomycete cytochrome C [Planctomycetes bacterium K23_9]